MSISQSLPPPPPLSPPRSTLHAPAKCRHGTGDGPTPRQARLHRCHHSLHQHRGRVQMQDVCLGGLRGGGGRGCSSCWDRGWCNHLGLGPCWSGRCRTGRGRRGPSACDATTRPVNWNDMPEDTAREDRTQGGRLHRKSNQAETRGAVVLMQHYGWGGGGERGACERHLIAWLEEGEGLRIGPQPPRHLGRSCRD
jgi:hypothetical protein